MCIYPPRHVGRAEDTEPEQAAEIACAVGRGETVLIVGFGAIEAADGASALRVLQSGARVDLLVTNVDLPVG